MNRSFDRVRSDRIFSFEHQIEYIAGEDEPGVAENLLFVMSPIRLVQNYFACGIYHTDTNDEINVKVLTAGITADDKASVS